MLYNLLPSIIIIMPLISYRKRKERLALALHIEHANRPAYTIPTTYK
jgi:hypothetical protein